MIGEVSELSSGGIGRGGWIIANKGQKSKSSIDMWSSMSGISWNLAPAGSRCRPAA